MIKVFAVAEANPVGTPYDYLNQKLEELKAKWDEISQTTKSWWKIWSAKDSDVMRAVSFIMNSLDDFILELMKVANLDGKDKKATVLMAVTMLYDYIVPRIMPIFLRPIAGQIRAFVLSVLISYTIDFIADKYLDNSWKESKNHVEQKENTTE